VDNMYAGCVIMVILLLSQAGRAGGRGGQSCRLVRTPHKLSQECFPDKECGRKCGVVQEMVCSVTQKKKCGVVRERKCKTLQQKECNTVQERSCQTVNDRECQTGEDCLTDESNNNYCHAYVSFKSMYCIVIDGY
jgi:hypothetical protein